MTYLVQVWRAGNGEWDTSHECATEDGAKTAFGILRNTGNPVVRVLSKPDVADVFIALNKMRKDGIVKANLVNGQWRWTLREGVE